MRGRVIRERQRKFYPKQSYTKWVPPRSSHRERRAISAVVGAKPTVTEVADAVRTMVKRKTTRPDEHVAELAPLHHR